MKNIFLVLITVCCSPLVQAQSSIITGVVHDETMEGNYVILARYDVFWKAEPVSDSVKIEDGFFTIETDGTTPYLAVIKSLTDNTSLGQIIVEPGEVLFIYGPGQKSYTAGTPLNNDLFEFSILSGISRELSFSFGKALIKLENSGKDSTYILRQNLPGRIASGKNEHKDFIIKNKKYPGIILPHFAPFYHIYKTTKDTLPGLADMDGFINEVLTELSSEDIQRLEEYVEYRTQASTQNNL